jgi:hypothetical protein
MTAALSSFDLGEGATVTARDGRAVSKGSGMASVAPADSGRITPAAEGREEGSQEVANADIAATFVRGPAHLYSLMIPARGQTSWCIV